MLKLKNRRSKSNQKQMALQLQSLMRMPERRNRLSKESKPPKKNSLVLQPRLALLSEERRLEKRLLRRELLKMLQRILPKMKSE
jgi:cytochrome oxidase assembly protein ShyY1